MALNRSPVFDDALKKSSRPVSSKSLIWEIYDIEKNAKNSHNISQSFRGRTAFEALHSATYLSLQNRLPLVTF